MDIITLTKEQIYLFHDEALKIYGGESGTDELTDGKIESILAQQFEYFGYDKYPGVFDKAAMLLYFFAKNHCFKDGNKRVALYSVVVFLDVNGYDTIFSNDEIETVIYNSAKDDSKSIQIDKYIHDLSIWISKKSIMQKNLFNFL